MEVMKVKWCIYHKMGHLGPTPGVSTLVHTSAGSSTQSTRSKISLVDMVNPICLSWNCSSFWVCSHRKIKGLVGTPLNNVLVHYVDASAPGPSGVVLYNPFKWDILLFIVWLLFVCLLHSKMNFIPQPQEKRSCRRQTQCSSTWSGTSVCLMIWWSPRPQIFLRP